jgi:hypothetical protein
MPSPGLDHGGPAAELAAARNRLELMQSRSQRSLPHSAWSGSLLPTTSLARIIAGDSWHRVRSPALSTLRRILKERVAPAHFHALAASPWARWLLIGPACRARWLLGQQCLQPGRGIDADAASALTGTGLATTRRHLETPYDQHLISAPARGGYRLRDLLRERARALAAAEDRAPMRPPPAGCWTTT